MCVLCVCCVCCVCYVCVLCVMCVCCVLCVCVLCVMCALHVCVCHVQSTRVLCSSSPYMISTYMYVTVVFEHLTEKHLPELCKLLKDRLQILSMISLSWFLTLFFSVLDFKVALNIIDCVFFDGPKVWGRALLYHGRTILWY